MFRVQSNKRLALANEPTDQDNGVWCLPNRIGPILRPVRRLARWTDIMARWPRQTWTAIATYAIVFLLFPLLCLLAYAWVNGLIL